MKTTFGDRLRVLVDAHFKGQVKNLSDAAKLPYTTVNEFVLKRKSNPKIEFVEAIAAVAPEVNILWLAFGIGEMNLNKANVLNEPGVRYGLKIPFRNKSIDNLHFGDVKRQLTTYRNYVLPEIAHADFLERVNVDDMAPEIKAGDIVGIYIKGDGDPWQYGKTYLLETDGGNLLKKVMPDQAGHLLMLSANTSYPPFSLPTNSILAAGLITEIIGRR